MKAGRLGGFVWWEGNPPGEVITITHRLSSLLVAVLCAAGASQAQPPTPDVIWEQEADVLTVNYSADGEYVVAGGRIRWGTHTYGRVDVFAAADGAPVANSESHSAGGLLGRTNRLAFSPDGQTMASANGGSRCDAFTGCHLERPGIFTWTFPALAPLAGRTDYKPARSVAIAPDGESVAFAYFGGEGMVRVHDLATLDVGYEMTGHTSVVHDVAWSPDGTLIASVANDGMLRVVDAGTGDLLFSRHHGTLFTDGWPVSVVFSPNGSRIATGSRGSAHRVKVWDTATGDLLMNLDGLIEPESDGTTVVAYSPNGHYLVGAMYQYPTGGPWQGRIRFWDAETGEVMHEYADMGPPPYHGGVRSIAFSEAENHRFAYVVGEIGIVKLAETDMDLRDTAVGNEPQAAGIEEAVVFPNPAREAARLRLSLGAAQHVRIDLLDMLGRRVAGVHDGDLPAGRGPAMALDTSALPAGVYLVRAVGETFAVTRTLTVVGTAGR